MAEKGSNPSGEYPTDKAEIAAFLKCCGHEPARYGRVGGRMYFYFGDKPAVDRLVSDYFLRKASVVALDFVQALDWAQTVIHQA
jgi:hypothetical protein